MIGQADHVGDAAVPILLALPREPLGHGDEIDRLATAVHLAEQPVELLVLGPMEVVTPQPDARDLGDAVRARDHAAEQRSFGFNRLRVDLHHESQGRKKKRSTPKIEAERGIRCAGRSPRGEITPG